MFCSYALASQPCLCLNHAASLVPGRPRSQPAYSHFWHLCPHTSWLEKELDKWKDIPAQGIWISQEPDFRIRRSKRKSQNGSKTSKDVTRAVHVDLGDSFMLLISPSLPFAGGHAAFPLPGVLWHCDVCALLGWHVFLSLLGNTGLWHKSWTYWGKLKVPVVLCCPAPASLAALPPTPDRPSSQK